MNANLIALTVADHDELSELRARVSCLEEGLISLRQQVIVLRNHTCDLEEAMLARED